MPRMRWALTMWIAMYIRRSIGSWTGVLEETTRPKEAQEPETRVLVRSNRGRVWVTKDNRAVMEVKSESRALVVREAPFSTTSLTLRRKMIKSRKESRRMATRQWCKFLRVKIWELRTTLLLKPWTCQLRHESQSVNLDATSWKKTFRLSQLRVAEEERVRLEK